MKRWQALALALTIWWILPGTPDNIDAQAAIHRNITVLASAAQTGNGANTVRGSGVDASACLNGVGGTGGYQIAQVVITAGSGTVNPFKLWLEVSGDGTNWAPLPTWAAMSATATAPTAAAHLIMNETAAQTSGTGMGYYSLPVTNVRAAWVINGTTPSETFSVILSCFN